MVPGPADLTSPGNLLEMSILRPHPRPTQSETPCTRPAMNFNKPRRWLRCNLPKTTETEGSKHQNFGSRYKGLLSYLQSQTPNLQNRQSLADACLLKMSSQIHKGDKKEEVICLFYIKASLWLHGALSHPHRNEDFFTLNISSHLSHQVIPRGYAPALQNYWITW